MKVVIIGGGACGASCATRLKRLDEIPRDKKLVFICNSGYTN